MAEYAKVKAICPSTSRRKTKKESLVGLMIGKVRKSSPPPLYKLIFEVVASIKVPGLPAVIRPSGRSVDGANVFPGGVLRTALPLGWSHIDEGISSYSVSVFVEGIEPKNMLLPS